jgi:hypothetical protein
MPTLAPVINAVMIKLVGLVARPQLQSMVPWLHASECFLSKLFQVVLPKSGFA